MSLMSRFPKLNSKILLGFLWALISIIYIALRIKYFSDIRLIDWIASGAMFTMGILSIAEGLKISKNNTGQNSDADGFN